MRIIAFLLIVVFLSCTGKKDKQQYLIDETNFLIHNPSKILPVNDTVIAFATSDVYFVLYNVLHNKPVKVIDVSTAINADSLYYSHSDAIDSIPYDTLVNHKNNGNKIVLKSSRLDIENGNIWLVMTLFMPAYKKYNGQKCLFLMDKYYYIKYDVFNDKYELYTFIDKKKKNDKIANTGFDYVYLNNTLYIVTDSTMLFSSFSRDSTSYVSQYFLSKINDDTKKIILKDTVLLPEIPSVFYINAKLPFLCVQKIKNKIFVSDFKKIFELTDKKVIESDLFKKSNQGEYLYCFNYVNDNPDSVLQYVTYKNVDKRKHIFLNQYNYKNGKMNKKEIVYADKILSYSLYHGKLYYFEQKGEDYYLNILPVEF